MIDILFPPKNRVESELLARLYISHYNASKSVMNGSKMVFTIALQGSGNLIQALAAGILSTGHMHAPVEASRNFIFHSNEEITREMLVPGFGNSVHKDSIDPNFVEVDNLLASMYPAKHEIVMKRQDELAKVRGKVIHRNAAAITACVAECLNIPLGMEVLLFFIPRMSQWVHSVVEDKKDN